MKVIIIGNGIAGSTAARNIRKLSNSEITMISDETEFPYSRTALMYIFMGHVQFQGTKLYEDYFWKKNAIKLLHDKVTNIHVGEKFVSLSKHGTLSYDYLVIATGSIPIKMDCPGIGLLNVQSLYHIQDLENLERAAQNKIRRAVIVGGGLIGIELAEMLHSRQIPVTYLVRETSFWNKVLPLEESSLISQHILDHGIDLRLDSELDSIFGNTSVEKVKLKSGHEIESDFVGITIGVKPNISWINDDSDIKRSRGILVNEYLQTNVEDIFAIGDCAEIIEPQSFRKSIEAVWYTARLMGECVAKNICGGKQKYNPGLWYNSAKFFDIEYQVYGNVPTEIDKVYDSIFWRHPLQNKTIRIVYQIDNNQVCGFCVLGIRFRQNVCHQWISEGVKIDMVIQNLKSAFFDPEFYETYEKEIQKVYSSKK